MGTILVLHIEDDIEWSTLLRTKLPKNVTYLWAPDVETAMDMVAEYTTINKIVCDGNLTKKGDDGKGYAIARVLANMKYKVAMWTSIWNSWVEDLPYFDKGEPADQRKLIEWISKQ